MAAVNQQQRWRPEHPMTVVVAGPTWQSHLARLVEQISAQGDHGTLVLSRWARSDQVLFTYRDRRGPGSRGMPPLCSPADPG